MQRFTMHVKLYALDERRSGKPWKEVQQSIKEKFNTDPPSIRAMEKWEKGIDREKLSRMIIDESRKTLPVMEETTLQQMATGLIPILWQARDAGEDMELEAWLWFFSVVERQLGKAKFEHFLLKYKERKSARGV